MKCYLMQGAVSSVPDFCRRVFRGGLCAALLFAAVGQSASAATLRVGVLKFGTVNWELDVIKTHGLDKAEGVEIEVLPLGGSNASGVALQGGAVDIIVSDWIWVSRQRAENRNYTFFPYSLTVGSLMVRPDSGIAQIADLEGKALGIAGGPVDKSWLLMRAYAKRETGSDLKDIVSPKFGAPPLLNQLMLRNELPAVINFWHYSARLKAAGMQSIVDVSDILPALGVDRPVPLLGWVFDEQWANENADTLRAFLRASYNAKALLQSSDSEWERLRDKTRAEDDATLMALRDAYRAGIPHVFGAEEKVAAAKVFGILAAEGGEELIGSSSKLSAGTFWDGFEIPQR